MLDVVEGDDTDPLVFESAHHDFHLALLSECGSVELLKMIDSLFSQSVRMRLLSASQRGGLSKAVIDEHVNLLELCSGTDIDKSIAGYHSHITRTLTLVLRNADPKEIQFSDLTLVKSYIASLNNDKAALG
jgi:DNA-binding GntR family transcriptional regulator